MLELLALVYMLLNLYWVVVCIDRGRFKPRTRGDLIMTVLLLPTVLFAKITFVVSERILKVIFESLDRGSILKIRTKISESWKKEL